MFRKAMTRRGIALVLLLILVWTGTAFAFETERVSGVNFGDYGQPAYAYLQYIDSRLPDRDCVDGRNTDEARDWIAAQLKAGGYTDDQITVEDFSFEDEDGEEHPSQNVIAVLPGQTERRIIAGAHYDGTGAGDNGSGTALLLETACRLVKGDAPPHTIVFVFFGAEENDCDGSAAYAEGMSEKEVADTDFMINMDSVICGDFCYLHGGVADFKQKRVAGLEAFEKVFAIGRRLGLGIRQHPWTFDNPAPGFRVPDYPSPSTGDWSDHISFVERGIPYVYIEASNWEIPGPDRQYDGDSETADAGKIMHTKRDTLKNIEKLFPGRTLYHLQVFSLLISTALREI